MPGSDFTELWRIGLAAGDSDGTARMKGTAVRRIYRRWNFAGQDNTLAAGVGLNLRNG